MGWIRTVRGLLRTAKHKLLRIPHVLKKKAIRSQIVRSVLSKQLGRLLTAILEIHILALSGYTLKWTTRKTAHHIFLTNPAPYMETVCEWTIDILLPTVFALQWHEPFLSFVCWTFDRPLVSLARRIQYMKPNDPYQFLRVKYSILVPCLLYVGAVITMTTVDSKFIQVCLFQTLVTQAMQDLWPLRQDWMPEPGPTPSKITLLTNESIPPCGIVDNDSNKLPRKNTVQVHTSHFPPLKADPFSNVSFK